jgi:tripartite-type tricarboxylate transporter receptor subunit TctC
MALLLPVTGAAAAEYPERTITLISPFSAGGGLDTTARLVASFLPAQLNGTGVIVENRVGAGGAMGARWFVNNAKPDGYTLLTVGGSNHYSVPWAQDVDYKPIDDFVWLARVNVLPAAVVVKKDFPANNLAEFVEYVRANPVTYSHTGFGGREWLQALVLEDALKAKPMTGIPYDGGGQAAAAVASGDADISFVGLPGAAPLEAQGLVKVLGMIGPPPADRPDMETFEKIGLRVTPVMSHVGIGVPKGTPEAIQKTLVDAMGRVMADKAFQEAAAKAGVQLAAAGSEEYRKIMQELYEISGKYIKKQ